MDEQALKQELNRIPLRYTLPISGFSQEGIISPGNATVTLINHRDRFFCVTNEHVVKGIQEQLDETTYCQIGNKRFDLAEAHTYIDSENDLCCFEVQEDIAGDFNISGESPGFIPVPRDKVPIEPNAYISFGGYPGCFRTPTQHGYRFDTFSHGGCLVSDVRDNTLSCRMERELEDEIQSERRWEELTELGGISGCPVFTWAYEPIARIELVGIVKEGHLRIFESQTSPIIASRIDSEWMDKAAAEI